MDPDDISRLLGSLLVFLFLLKARRNKEKKKEQMQTTGETYEPIEPERFDPLSWIARGAEGASNIVGMLLGLFIIAVVIYLAFDNVLTRTILIITGAIVMAIVVIWGARTLTNTMDRR